MKNYMKGNAIINGYNKKNDKGWDNFINIDIRFQISCVLFWLASCTLFNYFRYNGGIIIAGLLVLRYLTINQEQKFLFILSGLPFQAINKIREGLPSTVIVLYMLYIADYFLRRKMFIKRRDVNCLIVVLLLQILAVIRFDASGISIISALVSIVFAKTAIDTLLGINAKKKMYFECAWVFSLAVLVDVLCASYLFPNLPYSIYYEKTMLMASVSRFSGLNGDPNYYGQLIILAISFLITLAFMYLKTRKFKLSLICIVSLIYLSFAGLKSGSKGYAVSLSIIFLLALYFILTEGKKATSKIKYFGLFLLIGYILGVFMYNYVLVPIIESRVNTDLFTGRLEIWASYMQLFKQDPTIIILGTGFNNGLNVIKDIFGKAEASHNLYIEILGDLGMIGIVTLLLFWRHATAMIGNLIKNLSTLFVWGFLVSSLSLSASANDVLYFIVPILVLTFEISRLYMDTPKRRDET